MVSRRPRSPGRRRLVGVCLVSGVVFSGFGCKTEPQATRDKAERGAEQARSVKLVVVTETALDETIDISGTLDADERVTVSAKVPGRLAAISIDLASAVKRGQTVAQIETKDYALRVEQASAALGQVQAQLGIAPGAGREVDVDATAVVRQAKATLDEAQANATRTRSMADEGLASARDVEAANATAARAEAAMQSAREDVRIRIATMRQRATELEMARQQLADATIVSPIDGVVQLRRGNVGEFVTAGAAVAEIVRIDPLRLRVAVPERDAAGLRQGQAVRVTVPGDDKPYAGTVARLAPALDQQSRTLLVETDIQNPGTLRPGTLAQARIVLRSKPAPTVPSTAIINFAGVTKVITVEDGKAREKQVTVGRMSDDRVEILSGVSVGDRVVERPGSLQQGQPVRVEAGS